MALVTQPECEQLTAVAAMSYHHGSYTFLCENGLGVFLAHDPVGHVLYEFGPEAP